MRQHAFLPSALGALALALPLAAGATPDVGPPTQDADGVLHYPVTSSYQTTTPNDLRVLLPASMGAGQRRFLYVLPVEPGVTATYGDPVDTVRALGVIDALHLILVVPAFSITPWYADHPSDPTIRQESYLTEDIVPAIETLFPETPANLGSARRLLLGFSKSGMGAMSLILRHSSTFHAAAAWDAPLNQPLLSALPGMTSVFGTQTNYDSYAIPSALPVHASEFQGSTRLWLGGYSSQAAWRNDMTAAHDAMTTLGVKHAWEDGPQRAHRWDSGWLSSAIAFLDQAAPALVFAPDAGAGGAGPDDGGVTDAATDAGTGGAAQDAGAGGSSFDSGSAGAEADASAAGAGSSTDGGCGCSSTAKGTWSPALLSALLGWVLLRRRQRGAGAIRASVRALANHAGTNAGRGAFHADKVDTE